MGLPLQRRVGGIKVMGKGSIVHRHRIRWWKGSVVSLSWGLPLLSMCANRGVGDGRDC